MKVFKYESNVLTCSDDKTMMVWNFKDAESDKCLERTYAGHSDAVYHCDI